MKNYNLTYHWQDLIWLSGGAWNDKPNNKILSEVQRLKQLGVNIYPFGIGRPINNEQLRSVATKPDNVFVPSSYDTLEREKDPLTQVMVFGGKQTNNVQINHVEQYL